MVAHVCGTIRVHIISIGFVPTLVSLLSEDEACVVDDAIGIVEVLARMCHKTRAVTKATASFPTSCLSSFINGFDETAKGLSAPCM